MTVCILPERDEVEEEEIRGVVASNGGTIVGNPPADLIAAMEEKALRAKELLKKEMYDIVRPVYVRQCVEEDKVLPILEEYAFSRVAGGGSRNRSSEEEGGESESDGGGSGDS